MNLRWRIFEVKVRLFFARRYKVLVSVGILLIILAVVGVQLLPGNAPDKPPSLTPTVTLTKIPTSMSTTGSVEPTSAVPTPGLTEAPSSTPTPKPTETPSPTFTATPSATPSPTSPAEPTESPAPTSTPTPTRPFSTPAPMSVPLRLIRPEAGATVGAGHVTQVTFVWEGTLKRNQVFHVIVRKTYPPDISFESSDLVTSTWTTEVSTQYIGECDWQVVVLQNKSTIASSELQRFYFDPFPRPTGPIPSPSPTP